MLNQLNQPSRPGIYTFYVYNKQGICIHYREWTRPLVTLSSQEDQKLMFGLLFSLKSFTAKLDPINGDNAGQAGKGCSFHSFKTNTYKLSYFETAAGVKFVLVTDPRMGDLREALRNIYSNIYVEYVSKNPIYTPGQSFRCELFESTLDAYVKSL
eukprot:TRINITY_DN14470_c0_g1_i1.p1 TRINITY_DN14470_c0_g1~~TRINITY_DN14470_c0_g1_i1.p1  ORF type:complete len:155 (+),score=9.71 TRINITY_DN14470_c0_g1_i1:257-721(+)